MSVAEPYDIYGAIYILFVMNRIFGTAPYILTNPPNRKYKTKRIFIFFNIIKILLITIFMVWTIYEIEEDAIIGNLKTSIDIFCCTISIVFLIISLCRAKYVILAFKILNVVDERFKSLGIYMSYRNDQKRVTIHSTVIIFLFIVMFLTVRYIDSMIKWFDVSCYSVGIIQILIVIIELQYYNFVYIAKSRFQVLNEFLSTIEKDKYLFSDATKPIFSLTAKDRKLSAGILKSSKSFSSSFAILETVSDIHTQLTDMCTSFNKAFSIQLLFRVTISLIMIITSLFYFIIDFQERFNSTQNTVPYFSFFMIMGCIFCIVELYILARISDKTCQEANNCPLLLHNIKHACTDPEILDSIELYSIQMYHNKLQFTVCGLFPIDHTLLYSMTGAVTTYLIFLVQFSKSEQFMQTFEKQNNVSRYVSK